MTLHDAWLEYLISKSAKKDMTIRRNWVRLTALIKGRSQSAITCMEIKKGLL